MQKKLREHNWETLLDWTESPYIRTGLATNRLGVVCVGSTISLYINGEFLNTVWDTSYAEGKIGLTAETFEGEAHTLSHFDNLRVYAPTAALPPIPTPTLLPPTPTVVPPTPTEPPQPGLPFEDDFSDPGSGWEVRNYEDGSVGYKDGVYFVIAREKNQTVLGRANRSFDNIVIEVDATQVSAGPTDNNDYGVTCRGQANGDKYYLLISGDGYYSILKRVGGEFEKLADWTTSDVIKRGNASNQIRAVCDGSRLALYVNGELLAEASDAAFSAGDIGLTATTYEDEPTEVHFDNLRVYAPTAMVEERATPTPPPTATPVRPTPTRGPVEFDPIIFAQGLTAEYDPIMPSMTFPSGTRQVYAVWACRGMYPGLEQYHVWYHNGQELASATHYWEDTAERGRCFGELHSDTAAPLASGNYRLEVYVGTSMLQSGTFVIQ